MHLLCGLGDNSPCCQEPFEQIDCVGIYPCGYTDLFATLNLSQRIVMKIVIVIPTYNEAENVVKLVPLLKEQFEKIPHDVEVLFVDDNSPDGTADVLKNLKKEYTFVNLIVRKEKTGLGSAYVAGFKKAMKEMGADVVMEMDADLQHDPADVPLLIKKIDEGYDFVTGSRYSGGGGIPKEWAFRRKFWSWGGNLFARIVLGPFHLADFTNSFRATRVKGVMDQIDLDSLLSDGFAYKFDSLHRTHKVGAKMTEVPIQFGLRDRGNSKMEQNNMLESLKVVLTIRIQESISFVKFAIVGVVGFITDTAIFNILRVTVLPSNYSSAASGFIAMILTFLLNNTWSFSHNKIVSFKGKMKMFVPYAISSYIPIVFRSWLVGYAVVRVGDTALVANTAFLIGVAIGLVWNYAIYSKIIWGKKPV